MKIAAYILFIVLILAPPARPGQEITVVRGQDFPPYHYRDARGRETGFLIELIRKAGARMDLDISFSQLPWSRCLRMVKDGRADAMMNLFKTRERMTFMAFSATPLTREVNRFFTFAGSDLAFTGDLDQLKGVKIGAVRNYSYGKAFDAFAPRLNILRLETEKALILNLISHRCDVILGNQVVIRTLAKTTEGGDTIRPLGPGITDAPLYIGFSKARGHEGLARRFSTALKAVKDSAGYQERLSAYGL